MKRFTKPKLLWNFHLANWHDFEMLTEELDLVEYDQMTVPEAVKSVNSIILNAAKQSIPRGISLRRKPLWNAKLTRLVTARKKAFFRLHRHNGTVQERNLLCAQYNKACGRARKAQLEASRYKWRCNLAAIQIGNVKKLFSTYQSLSKTSIKRTSPLRWKGKEATTDVDKAVMLNHFYLHEDILPDMIKSHRSNKPKQKQRTAERKLKSAAKLRQLKSVHEAMVYQNDPLMYAPITVAEVEAAQMRIMKGKAAGPDRMYPEFLIHLNDVGRSGICKLFNLSWNSGCVPSIWKTATIIPIPKPNKDLSQPKSHRPISLTSAIVKWMERILLARLSFFLDRNLGRATSQAGSRIKHETTDLLATLETSIEAGFQNKQHTLAIFVDLTQAYDCVVHDDVLERCVTLGVHGPMLIWIKDYLSQ